VAGKALWREFATLFLPESSAKDGKTLPAGVLYQLASPEIREDVAAYPFRCIGLRTDMKAKVFEWIDAEFEVPPGLVRDPAGAVAVREAIQFAAECAIVIRGVFAEVIGKKRERHQGLRDRMDNQYWAVLASSFRQFILMVAIPEQREAVRLRWLETAEQQALRSFTEAASALGDDAASLRQRMWGETQCRMRLANRRKKYLSQEETANE